MTINKTMVGFWKKINSSWTISFLFSLSLVFFFLALFYLANWDFGNSVQTRPVKEVSLALDSEKELASRLGSVSASSLDYDSWAVQNNLDEGAEKYDGDPDGDSLPNYLEYVYGTNPNNADTDGDKYSDKQEIINGYDPDASGDTRPTAQISIEKIKVVAPMIWSKNEDEKNILKELENGTAHFAKTASPGQNGNMIISGHSSNYFWATGNYNYIFKDLGDLENGDIITVKTIQKNGRVITYKYVVSDKFITAPDDASIFENTAEPTLTLSTCWPIGTNFQRLIVKAELVK